MRPPLTLPRGAPVASQLRWRHLHESEETGVNIIWGRRWQEWHWPESYLARLAGGQQPPETGEEVLSEK